MGDEETLLAGIVAAPEDEAARLVYADWLDDRGQAERAEFIRTQFALDAAAATDPGYGDFEVREWELRAAVGDEWLDRLDGVGNRAYRALWARCVRAPNCLDHPAGRQRARRSTRNLMRRARRNVQLLVARLTATGYRFVDPARVHRPPARRDLAAIVEFERDTGWPLPISLAAFHREVGSVCLMGATRTGPTRRPSSRTRPGRWAARRTGTPTRWSSRSTLHPRSLIFVKKQWPWPRGFGLSLPRICTTRPMSAGPVEKG